VTETAQTRLTLQFRSASVSLDDLESAVSSLFEGLRDPDTEIAQAAARIGMAPEEFAEAEGSVDQEGKGFGDVVVIVALFAPALNHSLRTVWDDLLWPRIKGILGADALGDEVAEDDDDEDEAAEDEGKAAEDDDDEAAER
jgi:hypothetical protein